MGQAASSNDMISRPLEACMMEPRPIISRHERGLKYGYVTVKVSSLVPNRGQTDRGTSHIVYPKGAIFHGSNGAPDAVIGALSAQNGSTCSLPERVLLQDSRVHDLLVMHTQGWHIFPSPEVFSRHSGTCLVVGDRTFQHPPVPIKLGDCFRLGSVGIVVSEYKTADGVEERLDSKALQYLRDEAVAFDIAEEEACLAADEGGFDVDCPEEDVLSQGTHQEVEDALRSSKKSGNLKQVDECATINDDGYESGGDAEDGHGGKSSSRSVTPERRPTVSKYFCYMCYESHDTVDDPLVAPCQCRGDTRYLHVQCLQKWYQSTGNGVHAQVIRTTGNGAPACKICGGAYKTVFRNAEGKKVSLLEMNTDGPYVTLIVVTKHDTNASLFNTRFRLNFSSDFANAFDDNPNSPVSINIGRSSSCNMIVDYRTVSTRHARIFYENGQFMLQDQRSSNGTMVYLRDAIKLSYNRPVRLRMGRSTLSIEASTLTSRDSLFHPQEGRLSAAFCCGSTSAVDATANHSIQFDGSDILNEDSDEEVVQSSQEGPVSSMLTRLHLKKPPPSPEKIEKLPPLANLAPSDVYNTLVEVSRRPQAASMSGSRRGGNGTNVVSPRGNGSPGINDDPLDQSPRGSRHRNSRRLERLTQVANAELDLLSEEAQVQALLEEAIMSGSFRNANMLANDALPENHVSNRSIVVRSTSEASNQNDSGDHAAPAVVSSRSMSNLDYDNLATSSEVNNVLNLSNSNNGGSRNITPRDNSSANNAIGAAIAAGMNLNIKAATSPMSAANLLESGMLSRKLSGSSRDGSQRSARRLASGRSPRNSPRIVEVAEVESATTANSISVPRSTEPSIPFSTTLVSNILSTAVSNRGHAQEVGNLPESESVPEGEAFAQSD